MAHKRTTAHIKMKTSLTRSNKFRQRDLRRIIISLIKSLRYSQKAMEKRAMLEVSLHNHNWNEDP